MAEISIVYEQETGEFKGVRIGDETLRPEDAQDPGNKRVTEANTKECIKSLSRFHWVQHEHIELYHDIAKSICTIHVRCRAFKCC